MSSNLKSKIIPSTFKEWCLKAEEGDKRELFEKTRIFARAYRADDKEEMKAAYVEAILIIAEIVKKGKEIAQKKELHQRKTLYLDKGNGRNERRAGK